MAEKKTKVISILKDVTRVLEMCRQGKVVLIKEFDGSETQIYIQSASGLLIGRAGPKYRYMFEHFLMEHGNRDGLIPGIDQTAGSIK